MLRSQAPAEPALFGSPQRRSSLGSNAFEDFEVQIDNQFNNYKQEISQKPDEPDLPEDTDNNYTANSGDGGSGGGFMINRRRQAANS